MSSPHAHLYATPQTDAVGVLAEQLAERDGRHRLTVGDMQMLRAEAELMLDKVRPLILAEDDPSRA